MPGTFEVLEEADKNIEGGKVKALLTRGKKYSPLNSLIHPAGRNVF